MSEITDFEEKLIGCVQNRVELYDKTNCNFKNEVLKNAIWADIGRELGKDGIACKQSWKSLRNQYTAYLRKLKNPTGSGKKRPPYFRHSDLMRFLEDYVEPRKTDSNLDLLDELPVVPAGVEEDSQSESLEITEPETWARGSVAASSTVAGFKTSVGGHKRKAKPETPFEAKLLQGLDALNENEDEHEKFLLSLAPTFRRLAADPRKIAKVRMDFQKILFDAEFE